MPPSPTSTRKWRLWRRNWRRTKLRSAPPCAHKIRGLAARIVARGPALLRRASLRERSQREPGTVPSVGAGASIYCCRTTNIPPPIPCLRCVSVRPLFAHCGRRPAIGRKPDGHHGLSLSAHRSRSDATRSMSFPALSGVSADAANPWPRQATERTFLVAGVAGITQVFAAMCRSDTMNWGAHDPGASRQSDDDRISIS